MPLVFADENAGNIFVYIKFEIHIPGKSIASRKN
jgi:hypothetical protein